MFVSWHFLHLPLVQLLLSIPVYGVGLWFFGKSAFASLKGGVPNMDVLIFMGASAALFYSIYGTFFYADAHDAEQYLFYETGATIITFVLLGNLIEKKAVKKTTNAIAALNALQVKTANRIVIINGNKTIEKVDVSMLQINDLLQINAGDAIPADGIVEKGSGFVNESMLTGEAIPVQKERNTEVFSGTILTDGNLEVRVTKTINQTVLASIIRLVKNAQSKRPKAQQLGDRISAVFVPVVIGISLLTFIVGYWGLNLSSAESMLRAVAVLVISCPCAMGLATPTAVVVGIGKAARNGILIKGGSTLEEFAKVNTIVFDKTGTLTTGDFTVKSFHVLQGNEAELKNIIYNLELLSNHPIAKSIIQKQKDWYIYPIKFAGFKEEKGIGLQAILPDGNEVKLGSDFTRAYNGLVLWLNQQPVAWFELEDEIKIGADEAVRYFNEHGITTVLLSGDDETKVEKVAKLLGLNKFFGRQLPHQKSEVVSNLSGNQKVAMLGDGINDAPALSKANTGISFSAATDIARQSADIILMKHDIKALKAAHIICKQTYTTIKQNLFWAFFYNILCIPLAAAGFLHPMLGALSMALSDVIVIGNSIRLNYTKIN
jgi:Cu+-exporting ATPase